MNKTLKIILSIIILIVLAIVVAGHIKFNVLQDDLYIQQEDGTVIKLEEYEEQETNMEHNTEIKTMHPSWDQDGDGVNDCENDGSCDHTVDYTEPRVN